MSLISRKLLTPDEILKIENPFALVMLAGKKPAITYIPDIGMEELIETIIVGAIAGVIAYIVYLITAQTILATLIVIGAIVVAVISLIKGNNNFSMVDTIKNIIKFEFMQKEYRYERKNIKFK